MSGKRETIAVICPDSNLKLWATRTRDSYIGGGKNALLKLSHEWARAGHRVTIFASSATESSDGRLTVRELDTATGSFDVAVYITGSLGHFDVPGAHAVEAKTRLLWFNGPARIAPPRNVEIDFFVVPARFLARRAVEEWGIPSGRVVVIPGQAASKKRTFFGAPKRDPFAFVYASHPAKGLVNAVQVLAPFQPRYPALTLSVFGSAKLWGDALSEEGAEPLPPWVKLRGEVPQESLEKELPTFGVMPYLTRWVDSFPPSASEAMAAGVIVIATAHGAHGEFLRHGWDGFLVRSGEGNEPDLDEARTLVEAYLSSPDAFEAMRHHAIAAVPSWGEVAAEWVEAWRRPRVAP